VPAGANGVTFGLALIANGTLTTNDYSFVLPAAAATAARPGTLSTRLVASALARAAAPNARGGQHVHSHLRLNIPGKGNWKSHKTFPVPEWPGANAKSPT
jgi:hypothetical protein